MSGTPDAPVFAEVRALPPRPNLEFEHKRAKELLRSLKANDPAALMRAQHQGVHRTAYQLADAQLLIAREYGFASWPKLVAYFTTWDRHVRAQPVRATYRPAWYADRTREAIAAHAAKGWSIAPALATFVPRFYGKSDEEIFAAPFSEGEARLMVARRDGFASWDALMAAAENVTDESPETLHAAPASQAWRAISAGEYDLARSILLAHPELFQPAGPGIVDGRYFLWSALSHECTARTPEARAFTDWLGEQGGDVQEALNRSLVGRSLRGGANPVAEDLEFLIARGADPGWISPSGISVLEHLLLRCWNPAPVDLIARYVKPRAAFWIAAGMNDVAQLKEYFNRDGTLTDAAHNDRPDFMLVGLGLPVRPDVSDREVMWEASNVAGFNQRWNALDFLYDRGLPIDYSPYRFNLLHWAVGNRKVPLVEFLVGRGASLDLRGWRPNASAREMASSNLEDMPNDPDVRRIFEICGG